MSFMNIDIKIFSKMLGNQTQQYIKKLHVTTKLDLSQICKNISTFENQLI